MLDTSAFNICQEKKRPTLGRLWRACCTVQNWKRKAELIKGNVGWLDNLKISLIMCKLSKRSIWCHCHTNRKDLTDAVFWHLCPLTYGPGATNPALRESENYVWHKPKNFGPLWKVPEKHTTHHLSNLHAGNLGFVVIGRRKENSGKGLCQEKWAASLFLKSKFGN